MRSIIASALVVVFLTTSNSAHAEKKKPTRKPSQSTSAPAAGVPASPLSATGTPAPTATSAPAAAGGAEEADVQKIKEKYWARGSETEMGVVQNRLFTKNHKIEGSLGLGTLTGDPFLKTTTLMVNGGYHFDEIFSAHLNFWKAFVEPSSALKTLESQLATTANTNEPRWYFGGEAKASALYGKVSLLGKAILYFDAYASLGLGIISTESGSNPMVSFGIGQQVWLTQLIALNLAYKVLWYRETILGKVTGVNGNLGQNLGTRSNLSNVIMIGVSILLDPLASEAKPQP